MKKIQFTTSGTIEKELTQEELIHHANMGDTEAKKEILSQEKASAKDLNERVAAIEKYLGV